MIGYHANADLALIEQQLLDEFQNAGTCEQNHCMQCKAANNLTDREILLSKIKSAILYAHSGRILEAFREIDAASRYSFCDASFLHLVAGDLGRAAGCHLEACNAYKRVKWLHPVYYPEAVSRKGRTYTAELKRWRELGLKPVTVAMYDGEGGEKYLLELVADRLHHSSVSSPTDAKSQLAGLSGVECLYLEMVIDTLPGEEFEEEQWPVYGYSVVSSMGPYITDRQQAAETALTFVNHWFYYLQRQNPNWRSEIVSDDTWSQLSRMLRFPREYANSDFKTNDDIAHDMICGRRLRYSTGRQDRDWLDWLGSIEPKERQTEESSPDPVAHKNPALYVSDKAIDDLIEWVTVWEPSPSDECIQAFVEYPDDEEDEGYSDEGTINYRLLLKHLKKIVPHIDWRIEDKGYDFDDGYGCCWNAIAVPNEHLHEAEMIIERIEQSDDIMQFSGPEDFAGPIYDERGELRQEITEFEAFITSLRSYVFSGYREQHVGTSEDVEKQIMHLIRLLADLYASGARLTYLKINPDFAEYPSQEMPAAFQDFMMDRYGHYLKEHDINPFEQIAYACECLDSVQALYDEGSRYDIARAVADWQFGFRSGAGWASCVVDALKPLHEILAGIRYKGLN